MTATPYPDIRPLDTVPHEQLVDCFLRSFSDYAVQMPTDPEYYRQRWKEEGIDRSLSFGLFAGDRLEGFLLHAYDVRNGRRCAHNAATGIVPVRRGLGLLGTLYGKALPALRDRGVSHLSLEVIEDNYRAIRAYEKVGFRIDRKLRCFIGELPKTDDPRVKVVRREIERSEWEGRPQILVSWGNHSHCFSEENAMLWEVFQGDRLLGWFVIDRACKRIYQFDTLVPDHSDMVLLASAMASKASGDLRIINVDDRERHKLDYLENCGIPKYVDQYQMVLDL